MSSDSRFRRGDEKQYFQFILTSSLCHDFLHEFTTALNLKSGSKILKYLIKKSIKLFLNKERSKNKL